MTYTKPLIAVNATALYSGGARTILNQFLSSISNSHSFDYICYVPEGVSLDVEHVEIVNVAKKNWLERVIWDSFGFSRALSKLDREVHKVLSLQNTTMSVNVSQVIYLHQPLPFSEVSWPLFDRRTFKLYLYSKFYKYFIFLFYKPSTNFVVQTEWMANSLTSKFNVPKRNVHIIKPSAYIRNLPSPQEFSEHLKYKRKGFDILYPASTLVYKNHQVILGALAEIGSKNYRFLVTFDFGDSPEFDSAVLRLGLKEQVVYLGFLSSSELYLEYYSSDLIVFPSYIETFGLPLIEAAFFNKKIVASDLPYSREVLDGYRHVEFTKFDSSSDWARKIINSLKIDIVENTQFLNSVDDSDPWCKLIKLLN